jgi:hypothetical protein
MLQIASKRRINAMKRTSNWFKMGMAAAEILIPLLGLGCSVMQQTRYPSFHEVPHTVTVPAFWPQQHGASRMD